MFYPKGCHQTRQYWHACKPICCVYCSASAAASKGAQQKLQGQCRAVVAFIIARQLAGSCSDEILSIDVQATCAKTGEGLMDGMEWIAQRVKGEAAQAMRSPQASPAKPIAA